MAGEQRPAPLRLFIAVPAPLAVREQARAVMVRLRGAGDVRWVTPDRLHLTLKFLGDCSPDLVPSLTEILEESANIFSAFVVELGDVGAFPNLRKPQTLWLGVERAEALSQLAEQIEQAVGKFGFKREAKAFRPHLTLGRVKSPRDLGKLAAELRTAAAEAAPRIEWPVEEFELVRSELRPSGPVYTTLQRFSLRRGE